MFRFKGLNKGGEGIGMERLFLPVVQAEVDRVRKMARFFWYNL